MRNAVAFLVIISLTITVLCNAVYGHGLAPENIGNRHFRPGHGGNHPIRPGHGGLGNPGFNGQFPGNGGLGGNGQFPGNGGLGANGQFPGNGGLGGNGQFPGNEGFRGNGQFPGNEGLLGNGQFPSNGGLSNNRGKVCLVEGERCEHRRQCCEGYRCLSSPKVPVLHCTKRFL